MNVPRWSEIVIEGRILAGVREKEGPFGEFTGYASSRSTENVFEATALHYRNGAVYQDINGGDSMEHCRCLSMPREVEFTNVLGKTIPNLKAVHVPVRSGIGSFHCYVSMRKTAEGQGKQAIFSVLGADHYVKLVVVVDDDVDIFDEEQVLWAIATRMQADRGRLHRRRGHGHLAGPVRHRRHHRQDGHRRHPSPWATSPRRCPSSRAAVERARSLMKKLAG